MKRIALAAMLGLMALAPAQAQTVVKYLNLASIPEEVALMNEGKALAEQCGAYISKLRAAGVQGVGPDRFLSPELEAASALVASGAVVSAAREVVKELI